MSQHFPKISKTADGDFYALVVRIDRDGQEQVVNGFGGHYATEAKARKAAERFIATKC